MRNYIDTDMIRKLNPCKSRWQNYLSYYRDFSGTFEDFLSLENISDSDKVWVGVRLLPRDLLEFFVVDCAFSAPSCFPVAAYATDYVSGDADYVANAAADWAAAIAAANAAYVAADYTANAAYYATTERARQVDAFIYLVSHHNWEG